MRSKRPRGFYDRLAKSLPKRGYDPLEKVELAATVDGGPWTDSLMAFRLIRSRARIKRRIKSDRRLGRDWLRKHAHLLSGATSATGTIDSLSRRSTRS